MSRHLQKQVNNQFDILNILALALKFFHDTFRFSGAPPEIFGDREGSQGTLLNISSKTQEKNTGR